MIPIKASPATLRAYFASKNFKRDIKANEAAMRDMLEIQNPQQ
jgi:hypothetical protein